MKRRLNEQRVPIPRRSAKGRRTRLSVLVAALALVVLAIPLWAQGASSLVLVILDDASPKAQNETTIAAFASNDVLVATARDLRLPTGFSWPGYYRSTDGGAHWTNALVPGFPGDTSAEGLASPAHQVGWTIGSDPVITSDGEGRVYLAWLSFNPETTGFAGWVVLSVYSDFGAKYEFTSTVFTGHPTGSPLEGGPGSSRITDKEWIGVDDTGGACDGNVYIPWAFFNGSFGTKIVFQRSTDGGHTFSPITNLSHPPNVQNQGATIAVGPSGQVYVAWEDFRKDTILFTRSLDCGRTFEPEKPIASVVPVPEPLPGNGYRLDSFPRMAVDQASGNVYVGWADYGSGDADVLLTRSVNGGTTWSSPTRVNDVATNNQIFPAITVFNGKLDVAFYDSRNDPAAKLLDVYDARSTDGGVTFLSNVRVTATPFDPNIGITGGGTVPFLGDYNGVAANGSGVHPVWADNRNISAAAPLDQDIFTAVIP
jgi:hypothetical protein